MGFHALPSEPCIFVRNKGRAKLIILLYVDDFLLAGPEDQVNACWDELCTRFTIDDCGMLQSGRYLGMDVSRTRAGGGLGTIRFSMETYISESLAMLGLEDVRPRATPMDEGLQLVARSDTSPLSPEKFARMANVDYRAALGRLNWIASTTRSDVAYATQYLGLFQTNPSPEHCDAVVRVFASLKATASLALVFGGRPTAPLLSLWTDASWSPDPADSVSTRGHVVYHRGNLIAAKSKRITTAPSRSCSTGSSSPWPRARDR
jgi:hypothetical protein